MGHPQIQNQGKSLKPILTGLTTETEGSSMKMSNRLSGILILVGIWELLAPFIWGYATIVEPLWNDVLFGAALIVLAGVSVLSESETTDRGLDWVNTVIGLWLIAAPFILNYTGLTSALWNDIIVGIITVVLSAWAAVSVVTPGMQRTFKDRS
jgi:hypothetical protein